MNFAGGVRWTIMQNKEGLAFARLQDALIEVSTVPGFELLGLVLREAGFHGEFGFRQVQRLLQFEWFGHRFERSDSPLHTCVICQHAVLWFRCTAGNIGKQCKEVCYNEWQPVSAARGAQPFPASANLIG